MKLLTITAFLIISSLPLSASFFEILPQSGTGNVGDTLSFDVVLVPIPGILDSVPDPDPLSIFGYNVNAVFPSFLTFIDADEEGYFLDNGAGVSWDPPAGPSVVTDINDTISGPDGMTSADDILRLNFLVTAAGEGTIQLFDESLVDDSFNFLSVDPTSAEGLATQDAPVAATPEPAAFFLMAPVLFAGFFLRKRISSARS
jgi:hypothetical protein